MPDVRQHPVVAEVIAAGGIIDARSRPPIDAFLGDRTYVNLERTLGNVAARGWSVTDSMRNADLSAYLAECAGAGISHFGVPARVPNRWWGGAGNEPVFASRDELSDQMFVYAAVDPTDPAGAGSVTELVARGAKGIVLEPGITDQPSYVDDPGVELVCEACEAAGVPALVMGGGETGPDLGFSDPHRFDRLAARFPRLPIVNVHGGWPFAQGALGVAFRRPNVWMLADVYFPGLPGEADYVAAINSFLGGRFLFATGYPFCPVIETLERYLSFGITPGPLRRVLRDNAVELFGLAT